VAPASDGVEALAPMADMVRADYAGGTFVIGGVQIHGAANLSLPVALREQP